jgi:hypothetical protein
MPLNLKDYEIKPLLTGGEVFDLIFLETSEELIPLGWISPEEAREKNLPHLLEFHALMEQWHGWFESNIMSGRCGTGGGVNSSGHHVLKREKVFNWILSEELLEYYESERFIIRKEIYELVRRYAAPMADSSGHPPQPRAEQIKDAHDNAFIRDGDYWWITYRGKRLPSIKNIDGIGYIAYLLARPNESIKALDLYDSVKGVSTIDTGDMIEPDYKNASDREQKQEPQNSAEGARLLDKKTISILLKERESLESDLEVAKSSELAEEREEGERIKEKIQAINKELNASTNNRGEGRPFVDENERARQTTAQGIALARRKIALHDKDLSEALKQSLSGLIYKPDPDNPIHWTITP